ncbi:hypothetical protein C7T94_00060 [Pedobacter yulinensis]|uniref:Uncharacterized protein n=1 Tax=Pedobacter yulinensis TaxID=2126353 RepID=A0A2T3HQ49_9SPHI|nr:hypothetical protein [Pedobacter yulinensis]PST84572.1 hypothetical protein C7T94_00060 [Pedobacter yulinensis]
MYRRDLLTAEIQKLAQVLAKILRLKNENREDEAQETFDQSLQAFFDLPTDALSLPETEFAALLADRRFDAGKLDYLGQMMHLQFDPSATSAVNINLAKNLLGLYALLENNHHIQSFQNLAIQQQLKKYLSNADH